MYGSVCVWVGFKTSLRLMASLFLSAGQGGSWLRALRVSGFMVLGLLRLRAFGAVGLYGSGVFSFCVEGCSV